MTKVCNRCNKEKLKSEFPNQWQNKDGLRGECKECKNAYNRKYMTKDKRKHAMLLHSYGITLETYKTIKEQQNSRCAICNIEEKELRCELVVDHCHSTNKIRGLLCESCNLALGKFKDCPTLLSKALKYLRSENGPLSASNRN